MCFLQRHLVEQQQTSTKKGNNPIALLKPVGVSKKNKSCQHGQSANFHPSYDRKAKHLLALFGVVPLKPQSAVKVAEMALMAEGPQLEDFC